MSGGHDASEDRFKEIADAWEVLGDPEQRALYDAGGGGGSGCCSARRTPRRESSLQRVLRRISRWQQRCGTVPVRAA